KSPARFNFNGNYNSSSGSAYGYASIVSKAGTTAFGGGISNYSAVSARDTTYATPWGTTVGGIGWSSEYATQQLVEVGINMTRIGVDPSLYSSLNPCQSLFSNIFFKSRSSSSFTANLQDFVTPLTFLRSPVMDFSLVSDTLRCNHRAGTIMLTNHTTAGYYTWKAVDGGNISGSNSDGSLLDIDKPGSYILSASPAEGCPTSLTAAIVVPVDTFPPVATALVGISGGLLQLYGGNAEASKYPTPFGGSQGLSWNWTGPGGFGATVQYPVTDMVWGTYQLSVTENRNGCTAIASTDVSAALFNALLANGLKLSAAYADRRVHLVWEDLNQHADRFFTIERGNDRNEYVSVGVVWNKNDTGAIGPASFNFVDGSPGPGNNLYRVKATTNQGETYYSRTVSVQTSSGGLQNAYLAGESLIVNADSESNVTMVVYTLIGQALQKKELSLLRGVNTIPVSGSTVGAPRILVLLLGGKVVWSRKILL
ncbi:MAG TPA: hypothetical protein VI233_00640, partial [Puia sp.]